MLVNSKRKPGSRKGKLIRIAEFPIDEILPYIFTRNVRHALKKLGFNYKSREWVMASRKDFIVNINGRKHRISVSMGSHRYQLFAEKGIVCAGCSLRGEYFALERGVKDKPDKFHFNLYGIDKNGVEVMLTKDHVTPRSKGGKNRLSNYQPLCFRCNQRKADKVINVKRTGRAVKRANKI